MRQASALSMIKASHLGSSALPQSPSARTRHFRGSLREAAFGLWSRASCEPPHAVREIHNFRSPQFDPRSPSPCTSSTRHKPCTGAMPSPTSSVSQLPHRKRLCDQGRARLFAPHYGTPLPRHATVLQNPPYASYSAILGDHLGACVKSV